MNYKLRIIIKGHILNPIWKTRGERRRIRGEATRRAVDSHLDSYLDFIRRLRPEGEATESGKSEERIFSIWLQGEESAPPIVKACWNSIRTNCTQELVVLDATDIDSWIELPEHIKRKWETGKFRPAHFADICRLALLVKYGGLWADATDFIPHPLPRRLWDADFFVYMSGNVQTGWYAFIQNCFIRSKRGNFLASAWLELIYEYWRREDSAADYFIHQMLFRKLVENNETAAELFRVMPKINQDATHTVWFQYGKCPYDKKMWDALTSAAMFQKTEYKSGMSKTPEAGSFAEHMLHTSSKNPAEEY